MENVILTAICILLLVLVLLVHKAVIYIRELPARLFEQIESLVISRIDQLEKKIKSISESIDKK